MKNACVRWSFILVCAVSGYVSAADIREGLWEFSLEAEVGGQSVTATPMVIRQCISNQSIQELMAQMGGAGACQISDLEQSGTRSRWNLACTGEPQVSGSGEADAAGEQLVGRMNLVVTMGGQSLPMVQNFRARRVGECQ
jgi:Protein of unknown function (DUF3617)